MAPLAAGGVQLGVAEEGLELDEVSTGLKQTLELLGEPREDPPEASTLVAEHQAKLDVLIGGRRVTR